LYVGTQKGVFEALANMLSCSAVGLAGWLASSAWITVGRCMWLYLPYDRVAPLARKPQAKPQ